MYKYSKMFETHLWRIHGTQMLLYMAAKNILREREGEEISAFYAPIVLRSE